ncbi:MAG: CheR family methyltransferase [Gammaproteobacteria bacterium]|jgi:type IV pilus assembly protein PilK
MDGAGLQALPDLDERQFAQWNGLLERRIGMVIPSTRLSFLSTNLRLRMRELGCLNYQAYYEQVTKSDSAEEWTVLVDRLTVHETRFFRHPNSFRLVSQLVARHGAGRPGGERPFLTWSVGCATGEEPYSLAMVVDDSQRRHGAEVSYSVAGTDISLPALRTARRARYPVGRLPGIESRFQVRHCKPCGEKYFELSEALRARVCFSQSNVLDIERAPFAKLDLIYCQNLLIYFDRQQRERIMKGLVERLAPGGVLVLGPGEIAGWSGTGMQRIRFEDVLAYRRVTASAAKETQ